MSDSLYKMPEAYPYPSSSVSSNKPDQTLSIVLIVIMLLVVVGLLVALIVLPCMSDATPRPATVADDLSEIKDDLDEINKKLPVRMEVPTNPTSILPEGVDYDSMANAHRQMRQEYTTRGGKFPNTDTRSMIYRRLDCVKDNVEIAEESNFKPTWGRSH